MKLLGNNEEEVFEIRNGNFDGLKFVVDCIHEADNEALTASDVDLMEIDISIRDIDTGETKVFGDMKPILVGLAPLSWYTNEVLLEVGTVYDSLGASNPDKRSIAMPLDLGTWSGNYDITVRTGTVFAGDTDASSKVAVMVEMTDQVAEYETSYELYAIPIGSTQWSKDLGDGIASVTLVDLGVVPSQETDTYAWNTSSISSDEINEYYRIQDLQCVNKMDSSNFEVENGGNLYLHNGMVINNCKIQLTLQTANITAGEHYVFVERVNYDAGKVTQNKIKAATKQIAKKIKLINKPVANRLR